VNAEQWNALHPVGTLVFAYPGFRPEDDRNARRFVTKTRTEAKSVGLDRDGVVWVEDHGAYISLTHVDPVSESVWQAAKQADETAAAVAAQGALPVPVDDQPQPLDNTRLAEIAARVEAASKGPWKVCEDYSDVLDGDGHQIISHFHDADGQFTAHARQDVPALLAEVERLKARVAELEAQQPTLCGRTRDISGNEYPPCELRAGHWQAYCRGDRGRSYFLSIASNQPAAPTTDHAREAS
jgi:hypothetical protein